MDVVLVELGEAIRGCGHESGEVLSSTWKGANPPLS
jgi:hypothetical protein